MVNSIDDKLIYAKDLRPSTAKKINSIIDIISEIVKAEYERGKEDEKRWWSGFCANCTDADRERGEWIDTKGGWRCTACNKWANCASDYCPNCGSKMRGEHDQ